MIEEKINFYLNNYGLNLKRKKTETEWEILQTEAQRDNLNTFFYQLLGVDGVLEIKEPILFGEKFNLTESLFALPEILRTEQCLYYAYGMDQIINENKTYGWRELLETYGLEKAKEILKEVDEEYQFKTIFNPEEETQQAMIVLNGKLEQFYEELGSKQKEFHQFNQGLLGVVMNE